MRFAYVTNNSPDFARFLSPLFEALRGSRVEVVLVGPQAETTAKSLGVSGIEWSVGRRSVGPLGEARAVADLARIYREVRPTLAHHLTIKPNVYGVRAARAARVPACVCTVTGLGFTFTETGLRGRLLRATVGRLYRAALSRADLAIFQNASDRALLGGEGNSVIVPGGVDVRHFDPARVPGERVGEIRAAEGIPADARVVLMASRLLTQKGIFEYAEAARLVRERDPRAIFLLAGPLDPGNPAAIGEAEARALFERCGVRWLGPRGDIRELLAISDVVALPSYREGMPRILLEALSMGRAIVASDIPGCREIVEEGNAGLLVPPRDAGALSRAIGRLVSDDSLRGECARAASKAAREKFAEPIVTAEVLKAYSDILSARGIDAPFGRPSPADVERLMDDARAK